jgi:imidazolonepropionase-like amidohydrolase
MRTSVALHLAVVTVAALGPVPACAQDSLIVIRGATVIDMTGAPPRADQAVVVRMGRIAEISTNRGFQPPRGARFIDARGSWLIPGYVDMHAHVTLGPVHGTAPALRMETDGSVPGRSLRTLLAAGVTTIRDPGTVQPLAVAVRDSVARGQLIGPRMFVAGAVIDQIDLPGLTAPVRNEAELRAEIRRQADAGVDWIKLYATLPAPMIRAGIEEAHARGKPVVAHLFLTSWTDAANAGIDAITHAPPGSPALLPPPRRQAYLSGIRDGRFMFQWFEYVDFASPEIDSMVRALVAHRVVHDPTLVVFEAIAWGDSARITRAPELQQAAPSLLANWREEFQLSRGWTPAAFDSARAVWPQVLRFARLLHDRGVFLVAGTDANNPWAVPGPSFHRELELLVAAGIPTSDVLRIATRNGAEALGILNEIGTIEVGKAAELVLLSGDPLSDIRNCRRVALVVQRDRIWRPQELLPR